MTIVLGYKHALKIVARFTPSMYGWYLDRNMCYAVSHKTNLEKQINNLFK